MMPELFVTLFLAVLSAQKDPRLAFDLTKTNNDVWELRLKRAPGYIHSLKMAPEKREDLLQRGTWLVLAFGAFSPRDIQNIAVAARVGEALQRSGVKIQIGLRPFWDYDEMKKWLPEYNSESASPVWALFRDGKLIQYEVGSFVDKLGKLSDNELRKWVQKALK